MGQEDGPEVSPGKSQLSSLFGVLPCQGLYTVDPAYNTTGYKTSLVKTPEMARTESNRDFTKKMARL